MLAAYDAGPAWTCRRVIKTYAQMTFPLLRIRWRGDHPHDAPLLLVCHTYRPGGGWGLHRHDFAEVFWVESGDGVHGVNGDAHALSAGDVVCLRPDDLHTSRAGRDGLTVVNASFMPADVAALARRISTGWSGAPRAARRPKWSPIYASTTPPPPCA